MRFPNLIFSKPVIQDELTYLDASKSIATSDESTITAVNVTPETGGPTVNVWPMSKRGLVYNYTSLGNKTVSVEVVTGLGSTTKQYQVPVVSLASLNLFSEDSELVNIENDILGYLPFNRSTFNNVHYRAQQSILTSLDERKIWKVDGSRFTSADVSDIQEVKDWATYLALQFVFESLSNQVGDIFEQKASKYFKLAMQRLDRAAIRLTDSGVSSTSTTTQDLTSIRLRRV